MVKTEDKEVSQLRNQVNTLQAELDELQQYSRKNSLRIYGCKDNPSEVTDDIIKSLCSDKLGISLQKSDIDCSRRLRRKENGDRPIIVRFTSRNIKNLIFKHKAKLKGTKIVLKEDLTMRRTALYKQACNSFGYKRVWTNDCNIYVKSGGHISKIMTTADLESLRAKSGTDT
ncbi:l1 transposable element-related [Holotrichia oblita]|uniref:L1 transposable element-related n=1 Tax=Holotrichia oblita TaxID=644536 RepID=A0ACB9SK82_HOLOL|nr:l1 transposable element-related [Holotrichia oblita]